MPIRVNWIHRSVAAPVFGLFFFPSIRQVFLKLQQSRHKSCALHVIQSWSGQRKLQLVYGWQQAATHGVIFTHIVVGVGRITRGIGCQRNGNPILLLVLGRLPATIPCVE